MTNSNTGKKIYTLFIALVAWFAVIAQLYLIIVNRQVGLIETLIRFVSYFTILTNTLVAIYFTARITEQPVQLIPFSKRIGLLTAVTVYITVVGLVYQIILRWIWEPQGLQMIVDELLHSIIPLLVAVHWFLYENKSTLSFKRIPGWLLYPLIYLIYVLVRGNFSGFYPYPFVDVTQLGLQQVAINSVFLFVFFVIVSSLYIGVGRLQSGRAKRQQS